MERRRVILTRRDGWCEMLSAAARGDAVEALALPKSGDFGGGLEMPIVAAKKRRKEGRKVAVLSG